MRPPAPFLVGSLVVAVASLSVHAQVADPNTSEMQDRAGRVIPTRALPLMEQAARAADRTREQAAQVELLLREQRRTMALFLGFSGLSGEALQSKLADVMNATQTQLDACRSADAP